MAAMKYTTKIHAVSQNQLISKSQIKTPPIANPRVHKNTPKENKKYNVGNRRSQQIHFEFFIRYTTGIAAIEARA